MNKKIIIPFVILFIIIVSIPLILHCCFKQHLSGSDILIYCSSIMSLCGTLILGTLTYSFSKKIEYNSVRPLFIFYNRPTILAGSIKEHRIEIMNASINIALDFCIKQINIKNFDNVCINTIIENRNKYNILPNAKIEIQTNYKGQWNNSLFMEIMYEYHDKYNVKHEDTHIFTYA